MVAAGDQGFTVHAEADAQVRPGESVRFGLEPNHLYLFDVETTGAIGVV